MSLWMGWNFLSGFALEGTLEGAKDKPFIPTAFVQWYRSRQRKIFFSNLYCKIITALTLLSVQLLLRCRSLLISMRNNFCWNTHGDRIGRNIRTNHCSCSNYASFAKGNSVKNFGSCAEPAIILNNYSLN